LEKSTFDTMVTRDVFDLSELYQDIILKKEMCGYEVSERFYEIGSPNGLAETERYILNMERKESGNE